MKKISERMMYETIKNFAEQFRFLPTVENERRLKKSASFIVVGMGGSHLAADLLKIYNPGLDIIIHRGYGLPKIEEARLKKSLIILSSYSGNTEEVLDAYEEARKKGFSPAALSIGGKLLEKAKKDGLPYVEIPDIGIEPRLGLGFSLRALLKIMGDEETLKETEVLAETLHTLDYEAGGKELAEKLKGFVPVIYASTRNLPLAYNWKIKFNETAKIPAFFNVFPELNHNEMTGFDITEETKNLSAKFHFVFLKDADDPPLIKKRMELTEKLYNDRGLPVTVLEIKGDDVSHKIFSTLVLADWAAYYLAESYGVESEEVPMVEEFKKLMQELS